MKSNHWHNLKIIAFVNLQRFAGHYLSAQVDQVIPRNRRIEQGIHAVDMSLKQGYRFVDHVFGFVWKQNIWETLGNFSNRCLKHFASLQVDMYAVNVLRRVNSTQQLCKLVEFVVNKDGISNWTTFFFFWHIKGVFVDVKLVSEKRKFRPDLFALKRFRNEL